MKKTTAIFTALSISFLSCALLIGGVNAGKGAVEAEADSATAYPRSGSPGTMMYVNGNSTYFNTNEADLAVYFYNGQRSAWSNKVSHRLFYDVLPVMLPYVEGSVTWTNCIICRYNPSMDPAANGWDGVYNQSTDISLSNLLYAQNMFIMTGYNGEGKMNYQISTTDQFGVRGENHMYLDLSGFPAWEEGGAKFAMYFAYPNSGNATRWGTGCTAEENYYEAFCWKVEGQDNDHLYECVVPNVYSYGQNIWSMVIAVRLDPAATTPNWDQKWNQTQDLSFNKDNHYANIIHVNDWNEGQLDTVNIISREDRLSFYGQYFLDTVKCSGDGKSDATTSDAWNAVKADYERMSRIYRGDIWKSSGSESGSKVEQAMARYDYIVFKKGYEHADFINRATSDGRTYASGTTLSGQIGNGNPTPLIVLASVMVVSLASFVTIRTLSKKRKHE